MSGDAAAFLKAHNDKRRIVSPPATNMKEMVRKVAGNYTKYVQILYLMSDRAIYQNFPLRSWEQTIACYLLGPTVKRVLFPGSNISACSISRVQQLSMVYFPGLKVQFPGSNNSACSISRFQQMKGALFPRVQHFNEFYFPGLTDQHILLVFPRV